MTLRWRWHLLGDHVHVRVFVVETLHDKSGALAGQLVFRQTEWAEISRGLLAAFGHGHEVVHEDDDVPVYPDRGGRL